MYRLRLCIITFVTNYARFSLILHKMLGRDVTKFQGKCFGYTDETYFAVSNEILYNSIHFTLENSIRLRITRSIHPRVNC